MGGRVSLGYVRYGEFYAELFGDRTWSVTRGGRPDPLVKALLDARYGDDERFWGPSAGIPGAAVLDDLAADTGGTAHPAPRPETHDDDGVIY